MTIVSIVSDLHLEFAPCELPGGDVLLLLGDTLVVKDLCHGFSRDREWRYKEFCENQLGKYKRVLAIGGNHEPYGSCIETVPERMRTLFSETAPHAEFLDNQYVEIDGVRFVGSTLWATCGYGTANHVAVQSGMNDFHLIRTKQPHEAMEFWNGSRRFLPEDAYHLHQDALAFLKEAVRTDKPCVVFTHHAPTYLAKNSERYLETELDDAYCSNQHEFILDNPQIKLWASGHTHYRFRSKIGDTMVAANSRGYHGRERSSLDFDPFELDFDLAKLEFVS
jgi:hypothetical protein